MDRVFTASYFQFLLGFAVILFISFGVTLAVDYYANTSPTTQAAALRAATAEECSALEARGGFSNCVAGVTQIDPSVDSILNLQPGNDTYEFLLTRLQNSGDEHISGLNPEFASRLAKFFKAGDAAGHKLTVYSGYRSPQRQAQLFESAVSRYGSASAARKWVAPPPCSAGTGASVCGNGSQHNYGKAADLKFNGVECSAAPQACDWAHANASQFGLVFRLSHEPWHVEPSGSVPGGPGVQFASNPTGGGPQQQSPIQSLLQALGIGGGQNEDDLRAACQRYALGEETASNAAACQQLAGNSSGPPGLPSGGGGSGGGGSQPQSQSGQSLPQYFAEEQTRTDEEGNEEKKFVVVSSEGEVVAESEISIEDALEKIIVDAPGGGAASSTPQVRVVLSPALQDEQVRLSGIIVTKEDEVDLYTVEVLGTSSPATSNNTFSTTFLNVGDVDQDLNAWESFAVRVYQAVNNFLSFLRR